MTTDNLTQAGFDTSFLDTSIDPTDDFYGYATGGWRKNHPIPNDEAQWGIFMMLLDKNREQLHGLLEELANSDDVGDGSDFQKLRDFYLEGMDEEKLNAQRAKPLQSWIKKVHATENRADLFRMIFDFQRSGISAPWGVGVEQDMKNSTKMSLYLGEDGLGLPDRDYYTKDDEKSEEIRKQYKDHIVRMLQLLGEKQGEARQKMEIVFEMETRMAHASMTNTESRDFEKLYNKRTLDELNQEYPNIDWGWYFREISAEKEEYVVVESPMFFAEVSQMIEDVHLNDWKAFLVWRIVDSLAGLLSDDFTEERFSFYGKTLQGLQELKPRWKRVSAAMDNEILGKLYVERYFSEEAKKEVNKLVDCLLAAYRGRIRALDWMSEETKEKALVKLDRIVRKLGYPDKWRDYSKLEIKRDSYANNYFRVAQFEFERELGKLGKPVDREEWFISPATVNAFYHPMLVNIVFPAGILQPPFFSRGFDPAVNFGAMGSVIGHEVTHGFDNQGRKFGADGGLEEWWTKEDKKRFEEKAKILEEQFNQCEVLPGEFVNGELTLGENIADLGGISIAYDALMHYMQEHGRLPDIEGFTPEQRFFLSFAVFGTENRREELIRQLLVIDPHSPGYLRVNMPLSNMEEFHDAFGVKEGNGMYRPPEERVKIW